MSAIFLSDVHLRDSTSVKTKLVMRFLQDVASQHDQIFILGDLFDVWPGTTSYLVTAFKPVTDVLRGLSKAGHKISYVEGNHDFRLGNYFTDDLGIAVYPERLVTDLGGRTLCLMHGDLGNPAQKGYRLLRSVLRADLVHQIVKPIPPKFIFDFGMRSSKLSRKYQSTLLTPDVEEKIKNIYRKTAEQYWDEGFDVVMMGHTHIPDRYEKEVQGRRREYFNTGDWIRNFTYLEFNDGRFYTKSHPVKDL